MSDDDLDCGDNSCLFATRRGGMRTNGGCRCLEALESHRQRQVQRRLQDLRALAVQFAEALADADCDLFNFGAVNSPKRDAALDAARKAGLIK